LVPQSWFAEAATYLYSLENARDLSEIGAQKISNILSALNFEVDDGVGATLPRYRELAKKHKLPANLIIYLELAKRRNATLYTTNISLRKAADREGITRP
jgi:predicted nucleic acid-binding protein